MTRAPDLARLADDAGPHPGSGIQWPKKKRGLGRASGGCDGAKGQPRPDWPGIVAGAPSTCSVRVALLFTGNGSLVVVEPTVAR